MVMISKKQKRQQQQEEEKKSPNCVERERERESDLIKTSQFTTHRPTDLSDT